MKPAYAINYTPATAPYGEGQVYLCVVCKTIFDELLYWNDKRNEPYCGSHCVFVRNRQVRKDNVPLSAYGSPLEKKPYAS